MRAFVKLATLLSWIAFSPSLAHAQASITGTVKDPSGAVLPGVAVEAASPVLIERVRVATTDGTGQYRIVDLRPGTYTVTFTLVGFNTLKREAIELTGAFNAKVNAELKLGTVQETVTVTGESPIVAVQSVRRQTTMSSETLTAIPSARAYGAINSSAILNYNQTFNPAVKSGPGAWLQPLAILTPRFVRISAQFDF